VNAPVNHNALATVSDQSAAITMGFGSASSFELMQRAARLLAASTLVPAQYRQSNEKKRGSEIDIIENPSAIANCVVALNMAQRMRADPLMVMQNLYVVEGRPSWSSQWIIAAINGCGRFSPLRFELTDLGEKEVEYSVTEWVDRQRVNKKLKTTIRNWQCVAWAGMNRAPWPVMVGIAEERLRKYPSAFAHDATGLGNVISDYFDPDLRRRYQRTFADVVMGSGRARQDLFSNYISAIEAGRIRYPRINSAYRAHLYVTWGDLFGHGHPPDEFVAGAIAWSLRDHVQRTTIAMPQGITKSETTWSGQPAGTL